MRLVRRLRGYRPITFVGAQILLARGHELYLADLECACPRYVGSVPQAVFTRVAGASRLLQRVLRLGVRFGCRVGARTVLLAERRRLWLLDLDRGQVRLDHTIRRGSRPLSISAIEGVRGFTAGLCYGEYWDNLPREPVNIWMRAGGDQGTWRVAYTFPPGTIEHVHAVIPDPLRGLVWILTGDFEDAAGIWVARNDFSSVTPVLLGKQEFRCCWLGLFADRVVYATDSPLTRNSIRELILPVGRQPGPGMAGEIRSEHVMDIAGSSIYSCVVGDQLVFSTTVEPGLLTGSRVRDLLERRPGPGISGNHSDLIVGNLTRGFSVAASWSKDMWPLRLCEFGAVSFPSGTNPGGFLYAHFTGLAGSDGTMGVFDLG
jgi:hypothetical protein